VSSWLVLELDKAMDMPRMDRKSLSWTVAEFLQENMEIPEF